VVTRCLRKRPQDRYPDAKELVGDLKAIQREVESGISSRAPLGARLQEQWASLRDRTLGEWLLPARPRGRPRRPPLGLLPPRLENLIPGLFFPGSPPSSCGAASATGGSPRPPVRAKVRKMPEVRLVALDGMRFTVVADRAQARPTSGPTPSSTA